MNCCAVKARVTRLREAVQRRCWGFGGAAGPAESAPDTVTGGGAAHGAGEPGARVVGGAYRPGPCGCGVAGSWRRARTGSGEFRALVQDAYETLVRMDARLDELAARIARWAKADEQVQRLLGIPGIGPITATALLAAVGERLQWTGVGRGWLVPRQHSTGGREQLLDISKRGDAYVRGLLIHGARAVLSGKKTDPRSRWVLAAARRHPNVAVVALANRMARTAYALLARGGLPGRPRAANGLSGGQAAGKV